MKEQLDIMNKYDYAKTIFKTCMEGEYESHRRGLFDFPDKATWLEDMWKTFRRNNPKLIGLTYDKKNKDWFHEYKGGLIRVIL